MSDFLDSLIDRSLSAGPAPGATLRPMLPSRFEPQRATPLFGSTGWDSSPETNHGDTADQTSSPFTSAIADASPPNASVPGGDWDPVDSRSTSSILSMVPGPTADDSTRPSRSAEQRPRVEPAFSAGPQRFESLDSGDNSWLHHRMDDMTVQLQRLRGDMATPPSSHSSNAAVAPTLRADMDTLSRPVFPRTDETTEVGLRPAPAIDDAARRKEDSRSIAIRAAENRPDDHPIQPLPTSPDLGHLERLLSLAETMAMPPSASIVPEVSPPVPRQTTPEAHSNGHRSQQLSKVPDFGHLDQLLSLAGQAAMQPPPRIHPEDLPSSRQPAPVEKTINVTIGRVEVKATREPAPVRRAAPSQAGSSVMSLDDYLKQRAAGGL